MRWPHRPGCRRQTDPPDRSLPLLSALAQRPPQPETGLPPPLRSAVEAVFARRQGPEIRRRTSRHGPAHHATAPGTGEGSLPAIRDLRHPGGRFYAEHFPPTGVPTWAPPKPPAAESDGFPSDWQFRVPGSGLADRSGIVCAPSRVAAFGRGPGPHQWTVRVCWMWAARVPPGHRSAAGPIAFQTSGRSVLVPSERSS